MHTQLCTYIIGKSIITGASAGIGEACAREFAKTGANLVLTARRIDRLNQLKTELQSHYPSATVHCVQLDVRDDASVAACVDALPESVRDVSVLINNAGMVVGLDRTEVVPASDVDRMIDTNIRGPLNLVRAILPGMRERQAGHIINVGSIAGIEAYAGGSVYCATKHALNAITQVLRHELMDTPIRVSEIKPGLVNTEFSTVRFGGDKARADKVYEGLTPLSAQDIAEIAAFIATRPPHVQIADLLVLATDQAAATKAHRRSAH
ncbi:hypothetical protein SYNPS1DRAFT_32639 [Syncephalis pseudoplumigaleata]|uniref:Uncharacterized protein n=1 Tax=Syncephalis pseudoplumigaleata TaxID=1712513 RepID=A0A4P9Z427_9FUNG|nr:hypothetical protein SYNPS1DRAFT_32639 [Syncephalis pseudoplumigaleata]|eukprot:RKP26802.1 hypothetical protein SYNPS1DRAFT_32639 [Syncephalis pseudoplumigaleata]